jgi:hypothetical protein
LSEGKVRFRRFGGVYSFLIDELDQDLVGKIEMEEEEVAQ